MAKQRLVDFRGGINKKISPHMIGDSQGQVAQDVDSSSVRLEGRLLIDTSEKAEGSYFYESGNLSSNTFEGRWVSIYPEDDSTYLDGATDFAVWNKDLYVAYGEDSVNGELQVYRDGSTTATQVNFDEPGTSTYTTYDADSTSEFLAPYSANDNSEILIASVTGQAYVPPQTGIYPVTQQADTGEALYTVFDPPYEQTSPLFNSSHSRNTYTKNNTTYYEDPSTYRLQRNTGGSAAYTITLSINTVSQFSPIFQSEGTFNDYVAPRNVSPIVNYTFNVYSRNGTNYYYAPSTNSTLGVSAGNFYTQGGGGSSGGNSVTDPNTTGTYNASTYYWKWVRNAGFSGNVTTSNYSTLNSTYGTSYSSGTTGYYDQRSGTSNQTFNLYSESGTTYYAPTSNATINGVSLTAETFYTQSGGGSTTSSTDGPYVYNGYYWYITNPFGTNRIEIYWNNVLKATISPANYNLTEHVASDGYKYIRGSLFQSANYPYIYGVSRNITTNNDFTYSVHSRTLTSSNGTLSFVFGGSTKSTTSNISYATAESSNTTYTTTETINGSSVSVTYRRGTNFAVNQTDTKAYSIYRTYTNPVVYNNYNYSYYTTSQPFPATFTYQDITDTVPEATGIPDTPAFTYDDARTKLYLLYNSDSDVDNETTDNAQGYNWLQQGRAFSLADNGYYLRTLREDVTSGTGLPVVSGNRTLATLASGSSHVFGLSLDSTPQRLNFSIVQPTDVTNPAFKGYKLERIDNESSVDLGYIAPDSSVSFTYNSTTKAVTITGLGTTSSDNYRLKFAAYQDTQVRTTLNNGTAVTAKSNMSGVLFNGNDTFTIQLIDVDGTDTRFRAADFWLEKKVIEGTSSSTSDDIYAIIRCFDLFDRNSNAVQSGVITGVCDFLDAFPNGLSSGGLSSGTTQSGVPTYLKFLKEANNFFFAVGTESTPDNRYGSATNKADSFLFVSEYNNPRSWPLTGYVEFDASITGLASYPGELIAWTPSGTFRVTGSRYDQMRKSRLATTEGMPIGHHRSIAQVGRYLVWVSQSGICFYDGDKVTNLTRGRFSTWTMQGSGIHAGQYDDTYYVVDSTETGYAVDFALEGFPVTEIDLTEDLPTPTNEVTSSTYFGDTLPPVLVYKPSENKLYSRRGVIEGSQNRGSWSYKTRAFDGGSFGSLKLVRNVTLNGTGSGQVQVYLDGKPAFVDSNGAASPKTVQITSTIRTEPARLYLPAASADTQYGLNMADVWSVEIINWSGQIDWIDTEYEIISGA
jgi:hypothetical protein